MVKVTNPSGRSHRTALFIDAADLSGEFKERVARLGESLNGANIKVDIYAAAPSAGVAVQRVSSVSDIAGTIGDDTFDVDELRAWAREQGYKQVLFSVPA